MLVTHTKQLPRILGGGFMVDRERMLGLHEYFFW